MHVVSLLPSATEILFAIGAGDDVVGVTFECDHPVEARSRRIVSTTTMPEELISSGDSAGIDAWVSAAVAQGVDLYRLDAGALSDLDADLVLTQDLCAVCAVDTDTVDEALAHLGCNAEVLTLDPHTLGEVLDSIGSVGARVGRDAEAARLVADLEHRIAAVGAAVAGLSRPRVAVLEWTDPPFAPGHWIPEMVTHAGGVPALGSAGEKSVRIPWDAVQDSAPDLVVCAPCGFDLAGSAALADAALAHLPADVPVWAVDANAAYARPGPRLVDGIEALAGIFHAGALPPSPLARRVS